MKTSKRFLALLITVVLSCSPLTAFASSVPDPGSRAGSLVDFSAGDLDKGDSNSGDSKSGDTGSGESKSGESKSGESSSGESSEGKSSTKESGEYKPVERVREPGSWAIYWYLCGSDLETNGGWASSQLEEMLKVQLPDDVEVIIQTGGSNSWFMDIDPNVRSIYHYGSDGFKLLETWELANMGDPITYIEFLNYCNTNYPADNRVLLFWDHGGGTLGGVCYDEQFGKDYLSLPDLEFALGATSKTTNGLPLYEFVGFDCCLMATIDAAYVVADYSYYMMGSEDLGYANAWDYTTFFNTISNNKAITGYELGSIVGDTYYKEMGKWPTPQSMTAVSLIDLTRFKPLFKAYCNLGDELLVGVSRNQELLGAYGRAARDAQNFYNSSSTGYSCMVDLGDLVLKGQQEGLFSVYGDDVLEALADCVVFQARGSEHSDVRGLTCFYNYPGDPFYTSLFLPGSYNIGLNYLNQYIVDGVLPEEAIEYVQKASDELDGQVTEITPIEIASLEVLNNYQLLIAPNGQYQLNVGPEIGKQLCAVYITQAWVGDITTSNSLLGLYGLTGHFPHDFENGLFTAAFQNDWAALGDLAVYLDPMGNDLTSSYYAAPVLINDIPYALLVSQDEETGAWSLLGAIEPIDEETGRASKDMYQLQVGDKVDAIMYWLLPEGQVDYESGTRLVEMPLGEIIYDEDTVFRSRPVSGNSEYSLDRYAYFVIMFVMIDFTGNVYYSGPGYYQVYNGEFVPIGPYQF